MPNDLFHQDGNPSVAIAVLRERTEVLGREMREMKEAQREQMAELRQQNKEISDKMEAVLTVMSEARGGWRTMMLLGGASSTVGAGLAWLVQSLSHR